jgi:signal transduction histidine kinase
VQTLCHEIRNPLSAAMGSLELAQSDEPPGTPRAKNLSRAMDAMERQLYLLNVVLDVEKLEAHGTELLRMDVDLEALVRRAFLLMEGAAGKKAVSFELMEDGEGPWLLQGDPDRLLQCLSNLLGNAIKFTPSKSTVTVALARSIGIVRMEIRDQGEGLPKGFEDRIFGKFQQGGETPGGSGLGLSITRRLVEAMGGIVGVQSRPGEGATFWVELPAGS